MRHRKTVKKINKPADHRRALLRNLMTSFFEHEKVVTTKSRAKAAQQVAERLIKYSIGGTLEGKRRIVQYLRNRDAAHKLIKLGSEKFSDRPKGGYTAIYKLGYRKGDGAEMAILKLLIEPIEKKPRKHRMRKEEIAEVIEAVDKFDEEIEETAVDIVDEKPIQTETVENEEISEEEVAEEIKVIEALKEDSEPAEIETEPIDQEIETKTEQVDEEIAEPESIETEMIAENDADAVQEKTPEIESEEKPEKEESEEEE